VSAVGAAGYCWGGVVVVELAKAHEIQAAVILHPGPVTVEDIKGCSLRKDFPWCVTWVEREIQS